MKKGLAPIVWLIIAAVVLGGGYLFAQKAGYLPDNTPSDIIQPQTQADVDTTDWKTYRNEKYGFEFSYPSEYVIQDRQSSIIFLSTTTVTGITHDLLFWPIRFDSNKIHSLAVSITGNASYGYDSRNDTWSHFSPQGVNEEEYSWRDFLLLKAPEKYTALATTKNGFPIFAFKKEDENYKNSVRFTYIVIDRDKKLGLGFVHDQTALGASAIDKGAWTGEQEKFNKIIEGITASLNFQAP